MNWLILGNGYVGMAFGGAVSRATADYTKQHIFERLLVNVHPSAVVNCAGFTGRPNIDECETKRAETIRANIALPAMLSSVCKHYRVPFVHISSGCLVQGGPFVEGDRPEIEKLSFYSLTKWLGEQSIEDGYILRIRMPFSTDNHPRNLISKLMGYPKLISHPNSLTFLPDLVSATEALLKKNALRGIYNVTNAGAMNAKDIVSCFNKFGHEWNPTFIDDEEFSGMTAAPRSNCILDGDKLSQYFVMPYAEDRMVMAALLYPKMKQAA